MIEAEKVRFLKLSNGRKLAYSEYGYTKGFPVFFFHGSPGSRLEAIHTDKPGIKYNFRIISPDRPGMGKSDFQKNRTWLDWPNDVLELAAHLEIEKFGIIGASGGNPPLLACAYQIPNNIQFTVDMGGWVPNIDGKLYRHLAPIERTFGRTIKIPVIFRVFYRIMGFLVSRQEGEKLINNFKSSMCETDKQMIAEDHETTEFLANDVKESFRQGSKGPALDALLQYRDWGFDLREISIPVHIYHGTEDKFVPIQFSEALSKILPHSTLKTYPELGHFSILNMVNDVFRDMNELMSR